MEEWQRGFSIEGLRAFAAPFKARHKPLVFGAFGLTKERDLADYLARGRAIWTGNPADAIALFTIAKVASEQQDFAQRTFKVLPGTVSVKAFAAMNAAAGAKVLSALRERGKGAPVLVEIFEEDEIARAAVVAAGGFNYVATKISAGSEIKGLYFTGAPPLSELEPADVATLLVVDREFLTPALDDVRSELKAYGDHFAQHYSSYNRRHSWTAFALTGFKPDDPQFIELPEEMSKAWKEEHPELLGLKCLPTVAATAFPKTMELVNRIPGKKERIRFMRLKARGGELSRHADITDRKAGVADGFTARWHIPVYTSDAVTFHGWNARGEHITTKWPAGCLAYLDRRKPHKVTNADPTLDRVHLVIDAFSETTTRGWINYAMEESSGLANIASQQRRAS